MEQVRLGAKDVIGTYYQNLGTEDDRVYFMSLMLMLNDHNRLNATGQAALYEMLREFGSVRQGPHPEFGRAPGGQSEAGQENYLQEIELHRQELLRAIPANAQGEMIQNMLMGADIEDISSILAEFGDVFPDEMQGLVDTEYEGTLEEGMEEAAEEEAAEQDASVRQVPYAELYQEVTGHPLEGQGGFRRSRSEGRSRSRELEERLPQIF